MKTQIEPDEINHPLGNMVKPSDFQSGVEGSIPSRMTIYASKAYKVMRETSNLDNRVRFSILAHGKEELVECPYHPGEYYELGGYCQLCYEEVKE